MAYQSSYSFDELVAFVDVVDAAGFSAAARATGGRKATLSQRVQELERRLGIQLLLRTTRSLRLTDEGRAYYEFATRALTAARDAESIVLAAKARPSGQLRVTTSAAMGDGIIEHVAARYLNRYPEVTLQLETSDARADLIRDRFDLAVRVGALPDSSMLTRKLGVVRGGLFASPKYLQRRGELARPEALREHDTIAIPKGEGPPEWHFSHAGKALRITLKPRLTVSTLELATKAAAAGLGIVRAPRQFAEPYLRKQLLVPVLEQWTAPAIDVHAVFPPGGALLPKTRLFIDLLQDWLSPKQKQRARPTQP